MEPESSRVRGPGDADSAGLLLDGASWLRSRERHGCGWLRTRLFGQPWGRSTSSSGGHSAGMMLMMSFIALKVWTGAIDMKPADMLNTTAVNRFPSFFYQNCFYFHRVHSIKLYEYVYALYRKYNSLTLLVYERVC